jgi:predicted phosphodiesterase
LGTVVNLGDSLYGPLDPAGTARLLRELDPLSIRGNEDRLIIEPGPEEERSATLREVIRSLTPGDLVWLEGHRPGPEVLSNRILLCHGTPECDTQYLVERVCEGSVELKAPEELEAEVTKAAVDVILCAHSHVPRAIWLPSGRLIVNPGSVGLPAYTDDQPCFHAMEAGSPHARYAVLSWMKHGWAVEQISVPYDWSAAAQQARRQDRTDWANWLQTGRAQS